MTGKKILIVEDDPAISTMFKDRFELEKFKVVQSFNGVDGVEKALYEKPDLIMLDLMLPGKGGMNVLQVLKTEPVTKKIPVIVMTALADEKYREQSLRDGAIYHFIKAQIPVGEVIAKVKEVLGVR